MMTNQAAHPGSVYWSLSFHSGGCDEFLPEFMERMAELGKFVKCKDGCDDFLSGLFRVEEVKETGKMEESPRAQGNVDMECCMDLSSIVSLMKNTSHKRSHSVPAKDHKAVRAFTKDSMERLTQTPAQQPEQSCTTKLVDNQLVQLLAEQQPQ